MQPAEGIGSASRKVDLIAIVCVALIAIGWFPMSTLTFSVADAAQPTRFYQMLAVLQHPTMLLTGVSRAAAPEDLLFSLLCVLALAGALVPYFSIRRGVWITSWLPLLIMLACFAALYEGGAPARAADASASATASLGSQLLGLAHAAMRQAMQTAEVRVASHIRPGAGGVLSFLASVTLAARCTATRRAPLRNAPPSVSA